MKTRIRMVLAAMAAVVAATIDGAQASAAEMDACDLTTNAAFRACKLGARADTQIALGKCANLADDATRSACGKQASVEGSDALASCKDQNRLRGAVCERLGDTTYEPVIDPAHFGAAIDNPYFPLTPGTTFISEGQTADGFEHVEFAVTHKTKVILGVTCIEVHDTRFVDGAVTEDTVDWFAQDVDGNVWYFGENTTLVAGGVALVDGGLPVELAGTWTAGVDGAQPGIVMKAHPAVGEVYRQEFLLEDAEDLAEVKSLSDATTVAYGAFTNCVQTEETAAIAPGDVEHKFYAAGIGLILTVEPTGERVELVQITTN